MNTLARFREIAGDPSAYARHWRETTRGRVIGYFCTYAPEEIITAAGALPFRVFGTREPITRADAHLQSYCCSLVRGGLEQALTGELAFMDGTVFPHTCDSIQRLSDIWRLNAGFRLHWDVVLPVKLNTDSARQYLADVLKKFRHDLARNLGDAITDVSLAESIALYNRLRRGIDELYHRRSADPNIITGSDTWAVVKCSMIMDRREFAGLLETLLDELPVAGNGPTPGRRLVLAGGVCNQPDIYSIIEKAGGVVVWDELCTGSRSFSGSIDETGDHVEAIARRYGARPLCPAKHLDETCRADELLRIVKDHDARGVVFLILKFCDPHSFDYPYLKAALDGAGIPSMLLELEEQLPPEGQLRTRFEAFIEML